MARARTLELVLILGGLLPTLPGLRAQEPPPSEPALIQALADTSFKVRLNAATLAGTHKLKGAIPKLRAMLAKQDEHEGVRAAAALSLGRLGDEESRGQLAYLIGHKSEIISKSAEKALILLDEAMPQKPKLLVAIEDPRLPKATPALDGQRILAKLKERLGRSEGVVLGAGEQRFLNAKDLAAHLDRRHLTGVLLRPALMELDIKVEGGRTVFLAKVNVSGYSLVEQHMEFDVGGEANSWIEGSSLSKQERRELEDEVLNGATDSAASQALEQMQSH